METPFTCSMWMAQLGWDVKAILCKINPSLKVVAHDRVHWKFAFSKVRDGSKLDDFRMLRQVCNGCATLTAGIAAVSYVEDELDCDA
jgi:hypothetical protein